MRSSDVRLLLEAVRDVTAVTEVDEFPNASLRAVRALIDCDAAGYNEVDPSIPRIVFVTDPADFVPDEPAWAERWIRYAHEHPLFVHTQRTGDGSARRISDFLSQRTFHALALYREVYAALGIEYQIAITLPAPRPLVIAVVATRERHDFSERDRAVLDAFRPHLMQAYRNVHLRAETEGVLASVTSALGTLGRRVAVVDAGGELRFLPDDRGGADPDWLAGVGRDTVSGWIARERGRLLGGNGEPELAMPLLVEHDGRRIVVRYLAGAGGPDLLLCDEQPAEPDAGRLVALGLSVREAQVLVLVAQGLTNRAVARRLAISDATVRKHMERVHRKLGVSTRTEAAAAAFEALAEPPR